MPSKLVFSGRPRGNSTSSGGPSYIHQTTETKTLDPSGRMTYTRDEHIQVRSGSSSAREPPRVNPRGTHDTLLRGYRAIREERAAGERDLDDDYSDDDYSDEDLPRFSRLKLEDRSHASKASQSTIRGGSQSTIRGPRVTELSSRHPSSRPSESHHSGSRATDSRQPSRQITSRPTESHHASSRTTTRPAESNYLKSRTTDSHRPTTRTSSRPAESHSGRPGRELVVYDEPSSDKGKTKTKSSRRDTGGSKMSAIKDLVKRI